MEQENYLNLSTAINKKLHKVFKKISSEKEFAQSNVFICQLSITLALAMLTQGLEGESRTENIQGLGFDP